MSFINVIMMIRIFNVIIIVDFFAENVVLIKALNVSSYLTR